MQGMMGDPEQKKKIEEIAANLKNEL